jgi:hypothetical protein
MMFMTRVSLQASTRSAVGALTRGSLFIGNWSTPPEPSRRDLALRVLRRLDHLE